jgi:carboxypeptidase Taq
VADKTTERNGALRELKDILAEITDLSRAAALLEWDQETYMPPGGIGARAEQLSTLLRIAHVRLASTEVGRLLEKLESDLKDEPFDSDEASLIRVTRRDYDEAKKIPAELVSEIAHAGTVARPAWEKARKEEKFEIFAPFMEKTVELNRKVADALGYEDRPYDALINRTEPGMTTAQLETIFAELKRAIVPLVADIARHADTVDDRVLYRGFDTDLQLAYALEVAKRLGYDTSKGRQDTSTHPFSITFGPGDARITTRVSKDFFNECLFGSIHETGHALYDQGFGQNLDRTPLWGAASPGVHESQSRMWENLVGRSLPFWHHFYPSLQATFPEPLKGIDADGFYRAVNRSYPSFIRVEADEVTYNMHILLRFELENELLDGTLKVADLPEAWNTRFKSYLGLNVPNDREGCLQDIHWSYVSFGIFPGYTIGNLVSAQLMEKIRKEIPDLDAHFERGEFGSLLTWLRRNVHRHGRKFTPNELLERATGKPLTAAPWIAYVQSKFGALYGLHAGAR